MVGEEEQAGLQVTVIAAGFQCEVSRDFLRSGEAEADRAQTARTKVASQHEEQRESQAEPLPVSISDSDGAQVEYLFPEGDQEPAPLAKVEPDEDMGIPAFMRRRRRTP